MKTLWTSMITICLMVIVTFSFAQSQGNPPTRKWNHVYANYGGNNASAGFNFETELMPRVARNFYALVGVGFTEKSGSKWNKFSSFSLGLNYVSSGFIAFEGGFSIMPYFFEGVRSNIPNESSTGVFGVMNMGVRIKPRFSNGLMVRISWNPLIGKEGIYTENFGVGFGYSFRTPLRNR
jgi:hypothetical protein